jgi:hypothetical protein
MRNGNDLFRTWVHEMVVTAGGSEMDPSGVTQLPDDRPTVHLPNDVGRSDGRQAARRPGEAA